jgi:hypothetical protein
MEKKILELNGKTLHCVFVDGKWWVAVKPICEALGVNYNRQFQNIKEDEILGSVFAIQQIQIPEDQGRDMLCLPEKFIYGWVFSLRSDSGELLQYKRKCYEILYDYFEGLLTRRQETLADRSLKQARKDQLEQELIEDERYKELQKLKTELSQINSSLKVQDRELLDRQASLFQS